MTRNMPPRTMRRKHMSIRQITEAQLFQSFYNESLTGLNKFFSKLTLGNAASFLLYYAELSRCNSEREEQLRQDVMGRMMNEKPNIALKEIADAEILVSNTVKGIQEIEFSEDLNLLCDDFRVDPELIIMALEKLEQVTLRSVQAVSM